MADYRVNATDGSSRPAPLSDRKDRRKKGPSKRKKRGASATEADEHTDSTPENVGKNPDPDHVVDYYA